ncbi:MAG: hypothetical protein J1E64_15160 [Acetatifactor sp.]|nr:hypothetical protein [Acetatifactor sp.]
MNLTEKDINIEIDGMGIVMYSPKTVEGIPQGYDYLSKEYSIPYQVAEHLKKGDMVGFCTGSGGSYILKVREGYPSNEIDEQYPISIRLGIDIQDNKMCFIDLFWLMEWYDDCPEEQSIELEKGYYHITLLTCKPESGIWGDDQIIYVYLNKLSAMPELTWQGVPELFAD